MVFGKALSVSLSLGLIASGAYGTSIQDYQNNPQRTSFGSTIEQAGFEGPGSAPLGFPGTTGRPSLDGVIETFREGSGTQVAKPTGSALEKKANNFAQRSTENGGLGMKRGDYEVVVISETEVQIVPKAGATVAMGMKTWATDENGKVTKSNMENVEIVQVENTGDVAFVYTSDSSNKNVKMDGAATVIAAAPAMQAALQRIDVAGGHKAPPAGGTVVATIGEMDANGNVPINYQGSGAIAQAPVQAQPGVAHAPAEGQASVPPTAAPAEQAELVKVETPQAAQTAAPSPESTALMVAIDQFLTPMAETLVGTPVTSAQSAPQPETPAAAPATPAPQAQAAAAEPAAPAPQTPAPAAANANTAQPSAPTTPPPDAGAQVQVSAPATRAQVTPMAVPVSGGVTNRQTVDAALFKRPPEAAANAPMFYTTQARVSALKPEAQTYLRTALSNQGITLSDHDEVKFIVRPDFGGFHLVPLTITQFPSQNTIDLRQPRQPNNNTAMN